MYKFGEALRKSKAQAGGDRTLRGEATPKTNEGAHADEEPANVTQHHSNLHKVKGKVRSVTAEAVHGGHKVRVEYHGKNGSYGGHEEHFHASKSSAKKHFMAAMDKLEPEKSSADMAGKF